MQINVTGIHLTVTDAMRSYTEEKLRKLERHAERIIAIQVVLQSEHFKNKAEASLLVSGCDIVANAEHEDMYTAIDQMIDKLDRQLIKHKEKQLDRQQGIVAR